jgi:hypothetical protein
MTIGRSIILLGAAALVALAGFHVLRSLAPGVAVEVAALLDWSASDCQAAPVRCLEHQLDRLGTAEIDLRGAVDAIVAARGRMEAVLAEQDTQIRGNASLRAEAESRLGAARRDGTTAAIPFAGRLYTLDELAAQVNLIAAEGEALGRSRGAAAALLSSLAEKQQVLLVEAATIRAKRAAIPASIALVQSQATLDRIAGALDLVADASATADASGQVLRTTRELLDSAGAFGG